ncbi:MAG TPA: ribonuclease P protein component [Marmoricola sp.]|nr:ribonuclease P protein component [Marmoricola sp.]HMY08085.1 ribonuclease P protein component [Marmoricola sp.]
MLSAPNRLTRSDDFTHVVRRGRRAGGPLLVAHLLDRGDEATTQVGFVVAKNVGNAVTRNVVKRRLRHLMRERIGLLPSGSTLVVRAQPKAAVCTFTELAQALDRTLGRVMAQ